MLKMLIMSCYKRRSAGSWTKLKKYDFSAPVLKATEARLLLATAVANGFKVMKTDMEQES